MPAARAAYKRTLERLATAKLAWDRKHGNPDAAPTTKEQAIKFANEALEASVAPLPLGGDAMWNTIFGDLGDALFWRSDANFWFGAEIPSAVTPHILAEAHKHDELKEETSITITAVIWVKRFRETGRCAAKPRGGSISPLEEHAEFLLTLIEEQPDT